jgi:hypothetical protein
MKTSVGILLPLFLALASCGDDISRLGAGEVFECKVDDRDFHPRMESCGLNAFCEDDPVVTGVVALPDSTFYISLLARVDVDDADRESMNILVRTPIDPLGTIPLPPPDFSSTADYSCKAKGGSFFLDTTMASTVTISQLDTATRVVIGSFDLNLINSEGKKLRISEGKFNLKIDHE